MNRWMHRAGWVVPLVGWAVMMFATAGTAGPLSAMAVALMPGVALLMVATLIIAAGTQQRALAGALLGVLVWAMFIFSGPTPLTNGVGAMNGGLVIVSSNVRSGNAEIEQLVADLAEASPDVIAFQEIGVAELDAVRRTDLTTTHPFEIADPRAGYFGGAVYSRWPMTGGVEQIGGYPMIVATVESPYGSVDVINVHVAPPLSIEGHRLWEDQLSVLHDRLSAAASPLVALGDFNATPHHRELRRLAETTSTAGLGAFKSYPASMVVPPVMSLDHVFAAGGACLVDVQGLSSNAGSDHRAMRAIVGVDYSCPVEVSRLETVG